MKIDNEFLGQLQEIKTLAFQVKSNSVYAFDPCDMQKIERILFLADKSIHDFLEHYDDKIKQ
ncbi:hypothetical protein [Acinetobacter sp. NS-4]|uniref:hypothetical protein n=1 Tax=Acinetobacter sp. NS-4 TaxID=3127956 RepID=UPI00307F127E